MKKFKFSLDGVLSYKQQTLDAIRGEYAELMAQVHGQEGVVDGLWRRYRAYSEEYNQRSQTGLTVTDALMYQGGLRALEREIQQETDRLEKLRAKAEEKREQMVEAKKDTASIEKLREKKLDSYQKAVAKVEEASIEEFVSMKRAGAAGV